MTRASSPPRRPGLGRPPDPAVIATRLIVEAARSLAVASGVAVDGRRCRAAADSLSAALAAPHLGRAALLAASPFVVEHSGATRTLIEMVEAAGGDDAAKLRLALLLLRALDWRLGPERMGLRLMGSSRDGDRSA